MSAWMFQPLKEQSGLITLSYYVFLFDVWNNMYRPTYDGGVYHRGISILANPGIWQGGGGGGVIKPPKGHTQHHKPVLDSGKPYPCGQYLYLCRYSLLQYYDVSVAEQFN